MTAPGSPAGVGLLSIPCEACGAGAGQWCRNRRRGRYDRQHAERWDSWRDAGRPVIGPDGSIVTDSGRVVPA